MRHRSATGGHWQTFVEGALGLATIPGRAPAPTRAPCARAILGGEETPLAYDTASPPVPDRGFAETLLHDWRRDQLRRLGVPSHLADVYAGAVDWHELELLVAQGCDPVVAVDILR